MSTIFYDLMGPETGMNYRWVQPPQIAYLVSTIDQNENVNVTPITLGTCIGVNSLPAPVESNYYFAFSVGNIDLPNLPTRDAYYNLETIPECVISYPSSNLLEQIWMTALPIPRGINEMEVARLTSLPSKKVRPPGIQQCPVNMEAVVKSSFQVGAHFKLYVCQIVGVSVSSEYIKRDKRDRKHVGLLGIDPLFEVAIAAIENRPPRLYFGKIDKEKLYRTPDDLGSNSAWIGTFETWMEDEKNRRKISLEQIEEVLSLNEQWQANPDPKSNRQVKQKLTEILTNVVWKK